MEVLKMKNLFNLKQLTTAVHKTRKRLNKRKKKQTSYGTTPSA